MKDFTHKHLQTIENNPVSLLYIVSKTFWFVKQKTLSHKNYLQYKKISTFTTSNYNFTSSS